MSLIGGWRAVVVTAVIAPVIPSSTPTGFRRSPVSGSSATRRRLPLAALAPQRTGTAVYGFAAVDSTGRMADRAVVEALGWGPGTRLSIRSSGARVVLAEDAHGVFTISGQGHVRLPSGVRHWCGIEVGDRVLLVADPQRGRLVVYSPGALDAMDLTLAGSTGGDAA